MTDHLLYHRDDDGVVTLTMNRPQMRNASSLEMLDAMHRHLLAIESDPSIRCVVLCGSGEQFMAGGDVAAFAEMAKLAPPERRTALQMRMAKSAPIFPLIERLPQPVVASVRGTVAGGGLGFLLACDLAVAADDSKFVLSHVKLGLSPDGSSSWHLPRTIGVKKSKQMAFLADVVDAQTALQWGLVNWVVAPTEVAAFTARLVARLAGSPPESLAQAKRLLNQAPSMTLSEQVAAEGHAIGLCAQTPEFVEGVTAFMEKRPANFKRGL